jgi:ribosomal protein S27E
MSDRKYRQHGYQDEPRQPRREHTAPVKKEYTPRGQPPIAPKTFSMPGFREVVKCVRCGHELTVATAWSTDGTCKRCGSALHTCAQCANFDTGAAFECHKPVRARISPKDVQNTCVEFEPRTTVERETTSAGGPGASGASGGTGATGSSRARQAFDDLFK